MPAPAIVMGDKVTGMCPLHQIPGPVGNPQPGPPMPFSAPLTMGLCPTVLIGGKPAAVVGASGLNMPPHVGLHPADPFMVPPMQVGTVVSGSPTMTTYVQHTTEDGKVMSGTWQATPGTYHATYTDYEFVHLIKGRIIITQDGGEPVEVGPGDAFVVEADFKGTWQIVEPVTKHFVVAVG